MPRIAKLMVSLCNTTVTENMPINDNNFLAVVIV